MLSKLKMLIVKPDWLGEWLVVTLLHLYVLWGFSAEAEEWQACCFAVIVLLYAPPKVISELVLFAIFGGLLLLYFYMRMPS